MRVIYTSKGMLKKFGVRVIYQKIQYFLLRSHCDYCGQNDNIMLVLMKHSGIVMARGVEALKSSFHEH
jgi:transposase-like protein